MAALTAYRIRSQSLISNLPMLTIRLSRMGKKKRPTYRLIVSEKARDPWGRTTEILGHYDPRTKKAEFKKDRIAYWLSKGAQVSDTVWNLFLPMGLVQGKKRKVVAMPAPKAAAPAEAKKEEKPTA